MDTREDFYPSDYAYRFGSHEPGPKASHEAFIEALQREIPMSWPRLLGNLYAHREACMLAALRALDEALGDPEVTRQGLRRKMVAALAAIYEHGPEAILPKLGGVP